MTHSTTRRSFLQETTAWAGAAALPPALLRAQPQSSDDPMPAKQLAFTVSEYQARVRKVQQALAAKGLAGLLVDNLASICYLTGLESFAVHKYWLCLLPAVGDPILLTQDFESHNALLYSWVKQVETYALFTDPVKATVDLLKAQKLDGKSLGIELGPLSSISIQDYLRLREALPKAKLIDATNVVPCVGGIKSPAEIAYIKEAARISSAAMKAAIDAIQEGKTDNDIAAVAAERLIRDGSEYMCYQPIVTVGARSGIPHSTFHRVPIRRGDPVFMEFGACVNRYSAPIMRTAVVGKPPDKMKRMFAMCLASVSSSIEHLKPGAVTGEVATRSEKAIGTLPKGWVWHGYYAYSIGLGFPPEWGDCEEIEVVVGNKAVLRPGMVFHCSTSIRDPGKLGTTCSETVLITDKGCEVLTSLPRELFVR